MSRPWGVGGGGTLGGERGRGGGCFGLIHVGVGALGGSGGGGGGMGVWEGEEPYAVEVRVLGHPMFVVGLGWGVVV